MIYTPHKILFEWSIQEELDALAM